MWKQFLVQDESLADVDNPARQLAVEACRTADVLERIETELASAPLIQLVGDKEVSHPLLAEVRQQRQTFSRLVASLRLPDEQTGKKPQRRGSARAAYGSRTIGTVSAIDRMRQASGS